jgi:CheY-like chemotaxis protein
VELVQVSGQNLLTVINDVLDMAKLESGTMKLEHTSMDVRQLAEQTHGMFAPAARHKGIALDLHISSDLPPTMIGDTLRLRQVMNNLLGNAVKFTDHGRVALELEPGPSGQNAPTLVITVRDTGHGIPAHFMPRLFSAFSQGDSSTTRSHGGSGLGLALVKRLVDLMGGTVTATSTPGIGTCFRVVIPTMKHDIPATLLTVAPPPSLARPNPPLILLVEDNPANQQVTGMLLTEMGYRHQVAGNAVEALATMEKQTFDAVLLDCHLPGRNGFEIVGDIRAKTRLQARHLPIIAVTASAQDDDRRRCRAAGMDDFLAKPFTYEALEICLMRWLGPGG